MGNYTKSPSEGGSGGKRGHSRMEHYQPTAEIKENANRRRREDDKIELNEPEFGFNLLGRDW